MSDDLVAFLRARIDEREALAHEVQTVLDGGWNYFDETPTRLIDPARVLREVKAMRRMLDRHEPSIKEGTRRLQCWHDDQYWPCADVMSLASIYSDHPDYRAEWALD